MLSPRGKGNRMTDERRAASPSLAYITPDIASREESRRRVRTWLIIAFSIVATSAIAVVIAISVWMYQSLHFDVTFVVENDSAATIPLVQFSFYGSTYTLKNVGPGTVQKHATLCGSGPVMYEMHLQNGSTLSGTACSYLDEDDRGIRVGIRLKGDTVEQF
jgi:nitrate reductase NapE component